jgi:hypothetical protein
MDDDVAGRAGVRARTATLAVAWLLAGVAAAGLIAGCGGEDAGATDDAPGGATAPDRSAEPSGSEPDAVRPYIDTLLARNDEVVNEIVADPAVARDLTNPLVADYLELYEPDSEFAAGLVDRWVERADEGLVTQPFSEAHPPTVSSIDGEVTTISDDEVGFPYCLTQRLVVVGPGGDVQNRVELRRQRGDGVAVRVDGHWRLREITVREDTGRCEREEP